VTEDRFVDRFAFDHINLWTFSIGLTCIEALMTALTGCILPVHQFGLAADMKDINAIAHSHGLSMLEDDA